jgi:hypothetical protein
MEGFSNHQEQKRILEDYVGAIRILEEKYRRGEIRRLEDLLFGYDKIQAEFYTLFNPDGPPYESTWRAAVNYDGSFYTKNIAAETETLSVPRQRQHSFAQLLERLRGSLSPQMIEVAQKKVNDPHLTEEEFNEVCASLLRQAIEHLNDPRPPRPTYE